MRGKHLLVIVLGLLALILGLYFAFQLFDAIMTGGGIAPVNATDTTTYISAGAQPASGTAAAASTAMPANVAYYCDGNESIEASYGASFVVLHLSDGRTLSLPQVVSGSGVQYASANISFASKGSDAFLTENGAMTYANCVAGTTLPGTAGTATFTDAGGTFSFSYPTRFALSSGTQGYSYDWSLDSQYSGLVLARVTIPQSFLPGTNFGDARFTVGVSADPQAVTNCLVSDYGGSAAKSPATIGGVPFTEFTFTDVGAGNYYDTTSYHTLHDGECYSVEYTVHYANIYNYSPDQGVKQFNMAAVQPILASMAQSFRFLQ